MLGSSQFSFEPTSQQHNLTKPWLGTRTKILLIKCFTWCEKCKVWDVLQGPWMPNIMIVYIWAKIYCPTAKSTRSWWQLFHQNWWGFLFQQTHSAFCFQFRHWRATIYVSESLTRDRTHGWQDFTSATMCVALSKKPVWSAKIESDAFESLQLQSPRSSVATSQRS